MGYYYKHGYAFSDHGLQRIKQRLKIKEKEDFAIKDKIVSLINKSTYSFDTSSHKYIKMNNSDVYLVVAKNNNLIITATPISPSKQLELIENE